MCNVQIYINDTPYSLIVCFIYLIASVQWMFFLSVKHVWSRLVSYRGARIFLALTCIIIYLHSIRCHLFPPFIYPTQQPCSLLVPLLANLLIICNKFYCFLHVSTKKLKFSLKNCQELFHQNDLFIIKYNFEVVDFNNNPYKLLQINIHLLIFNLKSNLLLLNFYF